MLVIYSNTSLAPNTLSFASGKISSPSVLELLSCLCDDFTRRFASAVDFGTSSIAAAKHASCCFLIFSYSYRRRCISWASSVAFAARAVVCYLRALATIVGLTNIHISASVFLFAEPLSTTLINFSTNSFRPLGAIGSPTVAILAIIFLHLKTFYDQKGLIPF